MNLELLKRKLLKTARQNPPSDRVPFAFEKRVMARLRTRLPEDVWSLWGHALWRGAFGSLAVAFLLSAWALLADHSNPATQLSQVYDSTVDTAAEQMIDSW